MSANEFAVNPHFENREPVVRQIYDALLSQARKIGSVIEEPKKTSIHLVNKTAFAGVATRRSALMLTLKSDREIESPRIHRSERTSARRWHHEVKLTALVEVDSELIGWLKEGYLLSG